MRHPSCTFSILPVFLLVIAASCHKKGKPATYIDTKCITITCKNNAHCYEGECRCPEGLEDKDCGTLATSRYVGTWNMKDYFEGSSDASKRGTTHIYTITITCKEGVYDRFYINGLMGDVENKALECVMRDPVTHAYNPLKFAMTPMPVSTTTAIMRGSGYNPGSTSFSGRYIGQVVLDEQNRVEVDTVTFAAERLN